MGYKIESKLFGRYGGPTRAHISLVLEEKDWKKLRKMEEWKAVEKIVDRMREKADIVNFEGDEDAVAKNVFETMEVSEMTDDELKRFIEHEELKAKASIIKDKAFFKTSETRVVNGKDVGGIQGLYCGRKFRIHKYVPSGVITCNRHECHFNKDGECKQVITRGFGKRCYLYRFDKGKFCQTYPGIVQRNGMIIAGSIIAAAVVAKDLLPA